MKQIFNAAFKGALILIVDDVPANIKVLVRYLEDHDCKVVVAQDGESALKRAGYVKPDLILLDVMMPGMDGYEVCRRLKTAEATKDIPVVFMSALTDIFDKVKGFKAGAVDYITKPIDIDELMARVDTHLTISRLQLELQEINKTLELRVAKRTEELTQSKLRLENSYNKIKQLKDRLKQENIYLQHEIDTKFRHGEIVGESKAIKQVLTLIEKVAKQGTSILILGETGTGKELVARAIHKLSLRKDHAMIKINCAALPATLIESELFGREKGAYTGALTKQIGRFEAANDSTIFLDEIGDLPLELQTKLLRVLQEGEFERIGSLDTITVDVRVIAATNRDLGERVRDGQFRNDLFYRLNVFPVTVPPLRDRREDIPLLTWVFVKEFNKSMGKKISTIKNKTMNLLNHYSWPGNIRELKNVIERAMILTDGSELKFDRLETQTIDSQTGGTLDEIQIAHIKQTLEMTGWRISGKSGAAQILGLKPTTLRSKMEKLGIERIK